MNNAPALVTYWHNTSNRVYLTLVIFMLVLTGLEYNLPLAINQGQQMSWVTMIIATILGAIGLTFSARTGFPSLMDEEVSSQQRYWRPFLLGAGLGLIMIVFDLINPLGTEAQTIFPDSLVIFPLAGLVEEIIIHLFLTTLLIWVISGLILKNRHQKTVFWIVAVGLGLAYWLLQIGAIMTYFPEKFSTMLAFQTLIVIATTISAGAYAFRKGGFLAALSLRYGFYLLWHIIWGGGIGLVRYFM